MTHEPKTDYVLMTMALALKYYREEPISWMTSSGMELDATVEHFIRTTDVSAASRLNDTTFGRVLRIAMFDTVKQIRKSVREGKVAAPTLSGIEWLSWSLDKKQALVADYLNLTLRIGVGRKKNFRPDEVSLGYIESIDETAEKHPNDPRLNKFIGNFVNEIMKQLIQEFEQKLLAK